LLEITNLSVHYDEACAVSDSSFRVQQGELIALIGANGAGKSTTLKAISRLLSYSGNISFLGKDLKNLPPHQIVEMGLIQVPEGRRLFPSLTVLNNILLGAFSKNARKLQEKNLEEVFSLFPVLSTRKDQLARTLSGGEQQMLAIARGLMACPSLLMLDEPSLGLSPILVNQIFDILQSLNKSGTTILLVEQNVTKSLELANRAYVMENSRIVLEGMPQELKTNTHVIEAYLGI